MTTNTSHMNVGFCFVSFSLNSLFAIAELLEQGGAVGQPVLGYIPAYLPVYLPGFLGSQSAEVSCIRTTSRAMLWILMMFCKTIFKNKTTLTDVLAQKCEMRQILQIFQTKPETTSLTPWESQKETCKCFMLTHKAVCQVCQEIFHRNSSIAFFSKGEKTSFTSFKNYLQSTLYLVLVPKNCFSLKNKQTKNLQFQSLLRPLVFTVPLLQTCRLLGKALTKSLFVVAQYRQWKETHCVQL